MDRPSATAIPVTIACFLTYFAMSGMLAPIGIIADSMAKSFGIPLTSATSQFSWLTGGNFLGAWLALIAFDFIGLRVLLVLVYTSIALAMLLLGQTDSLTVAGLALGVVGFGCGLGLAAGAIILTRSYTEHQRASMLVLTDGCFSLAGFLLGWVATLLIAAQWHWSTTYQLLAIVALAVVVLASTTRLPETAGEAGKKGVRWPYAVWLCIAALFLYTLGQGSILIWLPTYAQDSLGLAKETAGGLVAQFWLGMFGAQLLIAALALKVSAATLVKLAGTTTTLSSTVLWLAPVPTQMLLLATAFGFANLGLLKMTISVATQMLDDPPPRLVSALLLGATLGTAVSPLLSSRLVEQSSAMGSLLFGSGCYVVLTALLWFATARLRPGTTTELA